MANVAHWLEADELPKCQRCAAAADERSFLCEDHAGEADEEVDTLREQLRGAVEAFEDFVAKVAAPTGRLRLFGNIEGDTLHAHVQQARAALATLKRPGLKPPT